MNIDQCKLLVVDDEPDLRALIGGEFRSLGATVFHAENSVSALEILTQQKFHVVISDVRMPGGDGISLLKEIRKIDPDLPIVILVSGFSDIKREDAKKAGATELLDKPVDWDQLVGVVKSGIALI